MGIKITRDTLSEAYFDALKIRNAVFVKEQGVPYALEVGNAIQEALAIHFVFYKHHEALGTVRLLPDDAHNSATIQRMAVIKSARNQHIATALMEELLNFAAQQHFETLVLHAQLTAHEFYERFDFRDEGESFEEAGIAHITMTRML